MTDKDEIKFAIRYLKQGLKSKRTPPLYEELMKELGFERKDEVIEELEKENFELKKSNKMLEQGYIWHDYDAGEDSYEDSHEGRWVKRDEVRQLSKAKEIIRMVINSYNYKERFSFEKDLMKAEQFLKDSEVEK